MTTWRKSSYSESNTPDCVELAKLDDAVAIRDSKQPEAGSIVIATTTFGLLVSRIKHGALG